MRNLPFLAFLFGAGAAFLGCRVEGAVLSSVDGSLPPATGADARTDDDVGTDTTGEAGPTGAEAAASSSSDAIAPVACDPGFVDAGAASTSDAEVPLTHRATAACCPAERGPGPSAQPYPAEVGQDLSPNAGPCTSDSDCTAGINGRCSFESLVGSACTYDECFTDSQCGSKVPCICRSSSTDNTPNACDFGGRTSAGDDVRPSNCAVDADCGPGGYCSPSAVPTSALHGAVNVCFGPNPFYCHTASDLCVNDSDCLSDAGIDAGTTDSYPPFACAYNAQNNRWECTTAGCALP
jgi:hypothetical protein